jgi:hypothetical protein
VNDVPRHHKARRALVEPAHDQDAAEQRAGHLAPWVSRLRHHAAQPRGDRRDARSPGKGVHARVPRRSRSAALSRQVPRRLQFPGAELSRLHRRSGDETEIRIYLAWRHERDLAVRAEAAPRPAGPSTAPETPSTERALPALHSGRGHRLTELAQDEGDAFFAEASNPAIFGDFLAFAMRRRRCRPVRVLQRRQVLSSGAPLSRPQEIVRRLLRDEDLPLADRVAGVLVVLFVSR